MLGTCLDHFILRSERASGREFGFLAGGTCLKRRPALPAISAWLMRIAGLQDCCAHNVYAVLRRPTCPALP